MTVQAQLNDYVAEHFLAQPGSQVPTELDLMSTGVVDSLGMLKLIAWIESEFDIAIADIDLDPENFRTVDAMAEFVDRSTRSGVAS